MFYNWTKTVLIAVIVLAIWCPSIEGKKNKTTIAPTTTAPTTPTPAPTTTTSIPTPPPWWQAPWLYPWLFPSWNRPWPRPPTSPTTTTEAATTTPAPATTTPVPTAPPPWWQAPWWNPWNRPWPRPPRPPVPTSTPPPASPGTTWSPEAQAISISVQNFCNLVGIGDYPDPLTETTTCVNYVRCSEGSGSLMGEIYTCPGVTIYDPSANLCVGSGYTCPT